MREYVTVQGDTWDIISLKAYLSEKYMDKLIDANSIHRETIFFSAGITLQVPDLIITQPNNLPPWKRGGS